MAAFIPIYSKLMLPGEDKDGHADNGRQLLWGVYDKLLQPLYDTSAEDENPNHVDGFR